MKFLVILLLATLASCHHRDEYSTCSIIGVTHMRTFNSYDRVDACFQVGSKVLVDNAWLKVSSHAYLNESTMDVDWSSTKMFVEFYGETYGLPIASFSSGILECDCASSCLNNRDYITYWGVDNAIEVIIRKEVDTVVAYLNYRRANISLYIRQTPQGLNFGINMPHYLRVATKGACTTGCQRQSSYVNNQCLKQSTDVIQPAVDICRNVLMDLQPLVRNNTNFEAMRLIPCSQDVFLWRNASCVLNHRYSLIDEAFIGQYDSILSHYNVTREYSFDWMQFDGLVEHMVDACIEKIAIVDQEFKGQQKNSTVGRTAFVELSGNGMRVSSNILPQVPVLPVEANQTQVQVDLTHDRFIEISGKDSMIPSVVPVQRQQVVEVTTELPLEWNNKCQIQRSSVKLGVFYLAYPLNRTMFVQCDESNRAFLKVCPAGTWFTVRMVCERMSNLTQSVVEPTLKISDILRSKAPLQINVPAIKPTTTTTTTEELLVNPCLNTKLSKVKVYPHPNDFSKFIQCDESNNMVIVQCPSGAVFNPMSRKCQTFDSIDTSF